MKKLLTILCLIVSSTLLSTTYYLQSGGNPTVLASWGTNPNGSGTAPTSFSGTHTWNMFNNSTLTLNTTFACSSTATVNIGDGINPVTFNFTGNGKFGLSSFPFVNVNAFGVFVFDRTYSILFNPIKTTINANSTFSFTPNADAIGADNYGNLVNNSGNYLPLIGNTSVTNLTITPGSFLDLASNNLTITGNYFGKFVGNNTGSSLVINGSGSLDFDAGSEVLTNLTIVSGTTTLLTNLTVDGGNFDFQTGTLNLNTSNFELLSSTGFSVTSGQFGGNPISNLIIKSTTISGNLQFTNLNQLNSLILDSPGQNLSLSTQLNILDSIKVNGVQFNSNGNLTLVSTSSLKGRVAEITGSGSINGNVTVQTFALGGTTDWSTLGASGISGLNLSSWDGQIPMTCNGCINGTTTIPGGFASAVAWDETVSGTAAYVTMNNTDPLTPGVGFWIYLGTGQFSTSNITWNVTGPLVQGNVNIPLTNTGPLNGNGFNLISNPYASPISWAKLLNANPQVNDAIYIYNADLGITTSYVNGVSSPANNSANDVIPAGQGFYVQCNSNTNLTATESCKVDANTSNNQLLKSQSGNFARLYLTDGTSTDDCVIRVQNGTTIGFDKNWDARKIWESPTYVGYTTPWSKRTAISTRNANEDYSINTFSVVNSTMNIPVTVRAYATGQHTISATGLQNLNTTCVDLVDNLTQTTHNLLSSPYIFNLSDTTQFSRFTLHLCFQSTGVSEINQTSNLSISSDLGGVYITDNISEKANIFVTNILGQKIFEKSNVMLNDKTYLNISKEDRLLIVLVETSNEVIIKKLIW